MSQSRQLLLYRGEIPQPLIREGLRLIGENNIYLEVLMGVWSSPLLYSTEPWNMMSTPTMLTAMRGKFTDYVEESYLSFQDLMAISSQLDLLTSPAGWQNRLTVPDQPVLDKAWISEETIDQFYRRTKVKVEFAHHAWNVNFRSGKFHMGTDASGPTESDGGAKTMGEKTKGRPKTKPKRSVKELNFPFPEALWLLLCHGLEYHFLAKLRHPSGSAAGLSLRQTAHPGQRAKVRLIVHGLDSSVLHMQSERIRFWIPYALPGIFARGWELSLLLHLAQRMQGTAFVIDEGRARTAFVAEFPLPAVLHQ